MDQETHPRVCPETGPETRATFFCCFFFICVFKSCCSQYVIIHSFDLMNVNIYTPSASCYSKSSKTSLSVVTRVPKKFQKCGVCQLHV